MGPDEIESSTPYISMFPPKLCNMHLDWVNQSVNMVENQELYSYFKLTMWIQNNGLELQDGREGLLKDDIPDVRYTVELRGHFPNGLDISK
jgi:hypothetical protein